eukprot:gene7220-9851_t
MANLFSNDGDLMQVEYARKAGLKGSTVICSSVGTGEVVICIPIAKASSMSLLDRRAVDKISKVSGSIWIIFSGLAGDGKALIREARLFCVNYRSTLGCSPSTRSVANYIAELQHDATLTSGKRPFGVQCIVLGTGSDNKKCEIYLCEPSGLVNQWKSTAIGRNSENILRLMEKEFNDVKNLSEVMKKYHSLLAYISVGDYEADEDSTKVDSKHVTEIPCELYLLNPNKKGDLELSYYKDISEFEKKKLFL